MTGAEEMPRCKAGCMAMRCVLLINQTTSNDWSRRNAKMQGRMHGHALCLAHQPLLAAGHTAAVNGTEVNTWCMLAASKGLKAMFCARVQTVHACSKQGAPRHAWCIRAHGAYKTWA
eukprot:751868-Pelagomonas_calceolata.AAC.1